MPQPRLDSVSNLARAGAELVRITIDRDESAAAVPEIRERLDAPGAECPWSATSTSTATCCCAATHAAQAPLAKYRINPGNVGRGRGAVSIFPRSAPSHSTTGPPSALESTAVRSIPLWSLPRWPKTPPANRP